MFGVSRFLAHLNLFYRLLCTWPYRIYRFLQFIPFQILYSIPQIIKGLVYFFSESP